MDDEHIRNMVIEGFRTFLRRDPDPKDMYAYTNYLMNGLKMEVFYDILQMSDEYIQKKDMKRVIFNSKRFSLLCPSRGRINMLENLLSSIENTANNLDDIELLIVIDDDDLETREYIKDKYYPFRVKVFVRNRSEYFNRDYYNWLVQYSEGKYLWAIGNDVVFKVKDWDKILGEKIEEYLKDKPDRIVCIGPKDDSPSCFGSDSDDKFACFPIITIETYNALNIFLHPELKTWSADIMLYKLYKSVDRYFYIDDVIYLEHLSLHKENINDSDRIRMGILDESSISHGYIMYNIVPRQATELKKMIYNKESKL